MVDDYEQDIEQSYIDILEDALDIEVAHSIGSTPTYLGAKIYVALGGPNIWIDTRFNLMCGAWWGDSYDYPLNNDLCEMLDDYIQECCNCY